MILIDTLTTNLAEFEGANVPPYAILSHTWGDREVTYRDMTRGKPHEIPAFRKIRLTCDQARRDGFSYVWVDTCCIDKSSSSELSEAVNSMYEWYQKAQICYVYLMDTKKSLFLNEERNECSRWFTRGWTLQELLAPRHVEFYDGDWNEIGTKTSLSVEVSRITGINRDALLGVDLSKFFVAEKFSWAAGRRTTREEDRAYSLLGLFNINMPLIYGEGPKAFMRLQKKIIKSSNDRTILAWEGVEMNREDGSLVIGGMLAESPDDFAGAPGFVRRSLSPIEYPWPPVVTDEHLTLTAPMNSSLPDNMMMHVVDLGVQAKDKACAYLRLYGADPSYRAGGILWMVDEVRAQYEFTTKTISANRTSFRSPEHDSVSFHILPLATDPRLPSYFQVGLTYFPDASSPNIGRGSPQELIYSGESAFYAATSTPPQMTRQCNLAGETTTILLPSEWRREHWSESAPPRRQAYTVAGLKLGYRHPSYRQTLARIAIGAIHDPVTRPWCIIDVNDRTQSDEEWFEYIVRQWDAGIGTPDLAAIIVPHPESNGSHIKIRVQLKRLGPPKINDSSQSYNVRIGIDTVLGSEASFSSDMNRKAGSERNGKKVSQASPSPPPFDPYKYDH